MTEIKNLKPECVWRNFHALTQVPRPSGHRDKIQQFLLDFAAKAGVEAFKDEAGNIVMRKPATPGMENRKGVIMQAHMDMVPQKSKDSAHNFETDPIETWIDGEWVKAKGTTLGADNGMGVAAILAVMEDKTLVHGPVEGLITADEETGMFGANDLPEGELHGDILLNLDSESWGHFCIGSAGGVDVTATLEYKEVPADSSDAAVRVVLKGLKGGHSGLEIHLGRANANKLMVRLVRDAVAELDARLATWHGGNMRNAIPFECETVLTLPKENVDELKAMAEEYRELFNSEFAGIENDIQLFVEDVDTPATEVPEDIQDNLIDAIYGCHNGVMRMIPCGWDPNTQSEILHLITTEYKELFGEEAHVVVDHAGLECSIILGKYPHLDVVSFGPTIRSPHTTGERCLISTIEPFWTLLTKTLENIPVK